ncbi:MAG: hypothetical protein ABI382_13205, partial [Nakamurella sp.]
VFDSLMPRVDPKVFDSLMPRVDPKVFDSLIPKIDPKVFANLLPRVGLLINPEPFDNQLTKIISTVDPGLLRELLVKVVPIIDVESLDRLVADSSWFEGVDEFDSPNNLGPQDMARVEFAVLAEDRDRLLAIATWFLTLGSRCLRIAEKMTQTVKKTNSAIEEWRKLAVTCIALFWFLHQFLD